MYTRRAMAKVRAGIELWRQEVEKGDGEKRVALLTGLMKERIVK
jgi:hypothetical protein